MSGLGERVSRLPLRIRLVAGFSAAMFVVLLVAGIFVYERVEFALDRGLDTELLQATSSLDRLVGIDGQVPNRAAAEATGVGWQVLDASDEVIDHGGTAGMVAMVSLPQLARVGGAPRTFDVGKLLPISDHPYRLRVSRTSASAQLYLLVGVRRDYRDEALRELLAELVLAGLGALALTAFVGDRLARAALRPVERYRSGAEAIAEGAPGLRLDVPSRRDDEVTRLGHTLNDMLSSLERALERERQFVNEASHELRTPITLLTGRIQLARRRPRTQAEHERVLEELQVDLDRLARLADQLLDLGASQGLTPRTACDVAEVVARVIEQRRAAAPARAGEVSAHLPGSAMRAMIPDFAVERTLTNLLDNAACHGSPPYEVVVDQPDPEWVRIMVTDSGPGMPPGVLETATRRFARAEEARSRPGAGLGLALVRARVEQSGGEIRLCHNGQHVSYGTVVAVVCAHSSAMTVSILIPAEPTPRDL